MFIRRVALFILMDKKRRILLQYRDSKAPNLPEYWAFFGGGIEKNETPEDAVKREAKEELGIVFEKLEFFRKYEFQQEDGNWEKFVFVAPLNIPIERLKKEQKEGENLGLFSSGDIEKLKIADYDRAILRDLFKEYT